MSGITCMMPYDTNSVTVVSSPAQTQLTRTPSSTVQHEMVPYCMICSYRQAEERPYPMFHFHSSPREVRILQGVEYTTSNPDYMCPTCRVMHSTFPDYGLNVCLGTSQLHNFHQPWDPTVTCPPDPFHIDWVTISGGTIPDLTQAFTVDYRRQPRPMRIFVTAGLNDLLRGTSRDTIVERFIHLKETIDAQNVYHPMPRMNLSLLPSSILPSSSGLMPMAPHLPTISTSSRTSKRLMTGSKPITRQMAKSAPPVGLGERNKFTPRILAHNFLVVKFNFKNISLNKLFDPRPF